mmetsp:Transcript_28357/g.30522  ORF Transcript_28357/g.30522 Transcript_28357/m.30522 type:complete len:117 (+) Transcript_28357:167-517(+)
MPTRQRHIPGTLVWVTKVIGRDHMNSGIFRWLVSVVGIDNSLLSSCHCSSSFHSVEIIKPTQESSFFQVLLLFFLSPMSHPHPQSIMIVVFGWIIHFLSFFIPSTDHTDRRIDTRP